MQTIGLPIPRVVRIALTSDDEAFLFGIGFPPREEEIEDVALESETLTAMREADVDGCAVEFSYQGDAISTVFVFCVNEKTISIEPETWRRLGPCNESWSLGRQVHADAQGLLEKGIADYWQEQNDPARMSGINSGCGLAQDLMLGVHKYEKPKDFNPWLSNRERQILATFVQWLGTNCGRCFLETAFRRGGRPISFRNVQ